MSCLRGRGAAQKVAEIVLRRDAQKRSLAAIGSFDLSEKSSRSSCHCPLFLQQPQRRNLSSTNEGDYEQTNLQTFDYEDDHEEAASLPWQTLLEPSARAIWRSSSHGPPSYLAQEHFTILQESERTSKQLRRAHKLILKSHMELALRRERERRRAVNPKVATDSLAYKQELRRDSQVDAVYYHPEKTLANLKYRLLPNYAIAKRVLMEAQSLLMADPSFQPRRVIDFGVGCGSASAAAIDVFDTLEWIHGIDASRSMRDGAEHVLQAVSKEHSKPPRVTLSESLSTERTHGSFDVALCAYTAVELPHAASMLTATAVLWEKLRPNGILVIIEPGTPDGFNSVKAVRDMLLECCPPDESEALDDEQCHVLAPCTHNGKCPMERHQRNFRRKGERKGKETRDFEWDEIEADRVDASFSDDGDADFFDDEDHNDGHEIDLDGIKDMVEDSDEERVESSGPGTETHAFDTAFCSFVHTFPGGSRRSSGEKFSYLVVQKRIAGSEGTTIDTPDDNDGLCDITELLAETYKAGKSSRSRGKEKLQATDKDTHLKLLEKARDMQGLYAERTADKLGLEFLHGDARRKSFGRIVRAPLKRRGHVLVDYCSSDLKEGDGRIVRHRVSKGWSARVAPGMYAAARKARWGGLWPDIKEQSSENEPGETGGRH